MHVAVTVRHTEVLDDVKTYALEKVQALVKYFENLQKAEVIFDRAKDGHYAVEMVVTAPRDKVFVGHASEATATAAVDVALDKLEVQLRKFKERLRDRSGKEQERATRRLMRRQQRSGNSTLMAKEDNSGDVWW